MVETFNAQYVSLHVRVSNNAAIHLYNNTLGFENEKSETRYYADGEDAYCMKLDLGEIREQVNEDLGREREADYADEGEPVGDVGKAKDAAASSGANKGAGKKRKVKVGRGLGVGDLVEKNESKH